MTHTITLSDEQFAWLEAVSHQYHRTPEQLLADLLGALPEPAHVYSAEEYDRRWEDFMQLVASIEHGKPLTNEDIDELIGEEAAAEHPADATLPDTSA